MVSMHGSIVEDLSTMLAPPQATHNTGQSRLRSLLIVVLSPELLDSPALPTNLIIALADGLATLALFVPFTYLPDLAMANGVSANDAAFLISAAGQISKPQYKLNPTAVVRAEQLCWQTDVRSAV